MSDASEAAKDQPKNKKAECSVCGGERNCDIHGTFTEKGADELNHTYWTTEWSLLQCRGCAHVFAQTVSTNSDDVEYYDRLDGTFYDHYIETINYWPAVSKRKRPDWMTSAGIEAPKVEALDASLQELYTALDNDLRILAGIGIRTSFDIASDLLGIKATLTFKQKLDALVQGGHIGKPDRARLEKLVDAGSASAHRGWKPTASDLGTMMDVLEHFIHDAFVAPARKKRMDAEITRMKVPLRPKKKAEVAPSPSDDRTTET